MKRFVCMRGIPGAGKSHYVREHLTGFMVCSADHFFVDFRGDYRFDPSRIGDAHRACFRGAIKCVQAGEPNIVVDNPNIYPWELAPYMMLADVYGYQAEIIQVQAHEGIAHGRNIHGVPFKTVAAMAATLNQRFDAMGEHLAFETLPPFWKVTIV